VKLLKQLTQKLSDETATFINPNVLINLTIHSKQFTIIIKHFTVHSSTLDSTPFFFMSFTFFAI